MHQLLVCRVGDRLCGIPIAHVSEAMRPLPVNGLAGTEPFVLGATVIRGQTVPVIDARRLLGVSDHAAPGRFVALIAEDHRAAVAVDEVLGVRAVDTAQLDELPALLEGTRSEAVQVLARLDQDLLFVLRASRVVPPSTWQALQSAVAR